MKLWPEGYKCIKKGIFCCTEGVAMTPKSRDHMPTMPNWPTWSLKTKLILCPRDPQGYSRISLSLSERILKEYRNIMSASKQTPLRYSMGFAKSHSLKYLLHKWVWCGAARKSARLNCINLIHFRLKWCGSIVLELVHCYTWGRLWIVTVQGNTVGRHS